MRIVFRTDASIQIGTGHVMRCLALADALAAEGAECQFISRPLEGNLIDFIRGKGYTTESLLTTEVGKCSTARPLDGPSPDLVHSHWLHGTQDQDAQACEPILKELRPDWLVVDHYALDERWERAMEPHCRKIMVIDDLADRSHVCDVLLDQNLVDGMYSRYGEKTPGKCKLLLGPQYALLRPEFLQLRATSLDRRFHPKFENLLVFLGGSDPENETSKVIKGIKLCKKNWLSIDVIVGQSFKELDYLREELVGLSAVKLHIQTSEMAQLMLKADIAITAGGSVTWEKCLLGLPSLVVIDGDNQYPIATKMHDLGAQRTLGRAATLTPQIYAQHLDTIQLNDLSAMTKSAQSICCGSGLSTILHSMGLSA